MAEAIITSPPPTLSSPLRAEPSAMSCYRDICILVSLANRGDSWSESRKYRWGSWECSVRRPSYQVLFWLFPVSFLPPGTWEYLLVLKWPFCDQEGKSQNMSETSSSMMKQWTKATRRWPLDFCHVGGRVFLWHSHCLSQVSTCCITKILIMLIRIIDA